MPVISPRERKGKHGPQVRRQRLASLVELRILLGFNFTSQVRIVVAELATDNALVREQSAELPQLVETRL